MARSGDRGCFIGRATGFCASPSRLPPAHRQRRPGTTNSRISLLRPSSMVHHRLNERESNPNPHVNFISALPAIDHEEQESARQLLRALAAQVRPVMKSHGFEINSLEEVGVYNLAALYSTCATTLYSTNSTKSLLGGTGTTAKLWVRSLFGCFRRPTDSSYVELVLRGADGAFQPVSWLMSTFCHEVRFIFDVSQLYPDPSSIARAYKGMCFLKPGIPQLHCIQHMNHSPAFQALWRRLNAEVRALQLKGYYGDGKDLMDSPRDEVMTHAPLNRLLVIRDASSRFCQSWWPWIRRGGTTRIYGSYFHPFSTPISLKCIYT